MPVFVKFVTVLESCRQKDWAKDNFVVSGNILYYLCFRLLVASEQIKNSSI